MTDGTVDLLIIGGGINGAGIAREVAWLMDEEWARRPKDVLWRRTKAGLHGADQAALAEWMAGREPATRRQMGLG